MRKAIMALEGLEELPIDDNINTDESAEQMKIESDINEAKDINSSCEDGQDVLETMDKMSIVSPEEAVQIATEHLLRSIGYPTKNITLESYSSNTNIFKEKLAANINIAQEGIFSRFGNTIKLFFTSTDKIHESAISAYNSIKSAGAKTDIIIEPGWGRSFSKIGKKQIEPADVLHQFQLYKKLLTSSEMTSLVNDYITFINKLSSELARGRFLANNDAVEEINKLNEHVTKLRNEGDAIVSSIPKTAKNDPSFTPLTVQDAKKLSDEVVSLLDNSSNKTLLKRLYEVINEINMTLFSETNTRIMNAAAKDIRAAQALINKVNPVLIDILDFSSKRDRICFACVNYIKASTVK